MTKDEFAARLQSACESVKRVQDELTEIDSRFGDADHGVTMVKIVDTISKAVANAGPGIKEMLDNAATDVMCLNGGSAVPLWSAWLDGMQERAPEGEEIDIAGIKTVFACAFNELDDMSGAKIGDKTMMDALIPASQAIAEYSGIDENELFADAAEAACDGAEATKNFVAKFGRAKSYGAKTIGTPDAGATSMAYFFKGLAQVQ
ncbi:MAG: DAK2 domain-containing protein [Lachnospiraceae bacterium]|jgi:dihydroxyacetone kinase-like protein